MIITAYGLIVFQLVFWIGVVKREFSIAANNYKNGVDMLGFAYQAIPTRHEVPGKTLAADKRKINMINKPTKLFEPLSWSEKQI